MDENLKLWFYCEKPLYSDNEEETYIEYNPDMKPEGMSLLKRTE